MNTIAKPRATVIISIYRDTEALEVILYALEQQTESDFSVVVSEDGMAPEVSAFLAQRNSPLHIQHLQQEDKGFRKNRALNRAVLAAPSDLLIFIDGDCVPHREFVRAHLRYAKRGLVNCGRRVNLGPKFSTALRAEPSRLRELSHIWTYVGHAYEFLRDGIKNYELGFYAPWLQPLMRKDTAILGCNFSLHRDDLLAINGFNEEYQSPGLGEDTDIEVRLRRNGASVRSNKLIALQYHLYHPKAYLVSKQNRALLKLAREGGSVYCTQGLDGHQQAVRHSSAHTNPVDTVH